MTTCSAPHSCGLSFLPPDEVSVDEATTIARNAVAQSHHRLMAKGVTLKPMLYEELPTYSQHKQLIEKVCARFAYEALHLTDRHQLLDLNPKDPQWFCARHIIQHWDPTMRMRWN